MKFLTLLKYEVFNLMRGKWFILYALMFAGFTEALLQFGDDPIRVALSLVNILLLVVPMVSLLYSTFYAYNSERFVVLLLTQPLQRWGIFVSRWLVVSIVLSLSFVLGILTPLACHQAVDVSAAVLLGLGSALTFIFVSLGLFIATFVSERMMGIGVAFLTWFYFCLIHDGLVFLVLVLFRDYPLEIPAVVLTVVNPIGLARLVLLMTFDASALMGYTGQRLQDFFSSDGTPFLLAGLLMVWAIVPGVLGLRKFMAKDF